MVGDRYVRPISIEEQVNKAVSRVRMHSLSFFAIREFRSAECTLCRWQSMGEKKSRFLEASKRAIPPSVVSLFLSFSRLLRRLSSLSPIVNIASNCP